VLLMKDSISKEITTLEPEATAAEILAVHGGHRIRHLPVLENGWWPVWGPWRPFRT